MDTDFIMIVRCMYCGEVYDHKESSRPIIGESTGVCPECFKIHMEEIRRMKEEQ